MVKKRGVWLFVIFLISLSLVSSVNALDTFNIEVLINAGNIDGFNSRFSIYSFNAQNSTLGNQVIGNNNLLKFSLEQGFYEIDIGVDDPVTPGFDYYGKISFDADADKRIEMDAVPVGSRKIEVLDMNDKPLIDVPVRIDCNALSGEQGYLRTDDFGIAEASFLPVGKCTFRAAAGDFVTSQEDTIDKGSTKNLIVKFDRYSSDKSNTGLIIAILAIIIIGALILLYLLYYRNTIEKNDNKIGSPESTTAVKHEIAVKHDIKSSESEDNIIDSHEDSKENTDSIKKDIMTALTANERKVVNFILEEQEKHVSKNNSAKGFYLHQAKIVYGANIPKTTLVRLLQSLEAKKIIEWERSGKIKKVRLTEWFDSK